MKFALLLALLLAVPSAYCGEPGQHEPRADDLIVICGQFFHTGTKVVLWMDPGGYDAYRVERRYVPIGQAGWRASKEHMISPNRYGMRDEIIGAAQLEKVRGGGWDLPALQSVVDQFVWHYDVDGCSRACFEMLHDKANLSVHFMLDLDGTLYQTLDLKEEAWHATSSNPRSIGIEIANVGAYAEGEKDPMAAWFKTNETGGVSITIPPKFGRHPELVKNFIGHPVRKELIVGDVQGRKLRQHDYTQEQYRALVKLTASLCIIFPKIKCDYPREADGKLMLHKLPDEQLKNYQGILGHYHIQTDKRDPGPALQWDYIVDNARSLLKLPPVPDVEGQPVTEAPKLIKDN